MRRGRQLCCRGALSLSLCWCVAATWYWYTGHVASRYIDRGSTKPQVCNRHFSLQAVNWNVRPIRRPAANFVVATIYRDAGWELSGEGVGGSTPSYFLIPPIKLFFVMGLAITILTGGNTPPMPHPSTPPSHTAVTYEKYACHVWQCYTMAL